MLCLFMGDVYADLAALLGPFRWVTWAGFLELLQVPTKRRGTNIGIILPCHTQALSSFTDCSSVKRL